MLKVIEGRVYKLSGNTDLTNNYMQYINCFWNVLVTMTTVVMVIIILLEFLEDLLVLSYWNCYCLFKY